MSERMDFPVLRLQYRAFLSGMSCLPSYYMLIFFFVSEMSHRTFIALRDALDPR